LAHMCRSSRDAEHRGKAFANFALRLPPLARAKHSCFAAGLKSAIEESLFGFGARLQIKPEERFFVRPPRRGLRMTRHGLLALLTMPRHCTTAQAQPQHAECRNYNLTPSVTLSIDCGGFCGNFWAIFGE
jgi:hypothetical protein